MWFPTAVFIREGREKPVPQNFVQYEKKQIVFLLKKQKKCRAVKKAL